MLDQNTDRSWWMISAVMVGAAGAAIALVAFPELLESVVAFGKSMIPTSL